MHFQTHIASQDMKIFKHDCYNIFVVLIFVISQQFFYDVLKHPPGIPFKNIHRILKILTFVQRSYLRSYEFWHWRDLETLFINT
jgi:hypothetical protein